MRYRVPAAGLDTCNRKILYERCTPAFSWNLGDKEVDDMVITPSY